VHSGGQATVGTVEKSSPGQSSRSEDYDAKTHVSFIHHTGKDASKGSRGHSLLRAATDTEIEVKLGKLAVTKQRDLESKDRKFGFKLHKVTVGYRKDGKPITSCWAETTLEQKPVATVSDGLLDVVNKLDAAIASECKNDEAAIEAFTFDAQYVGAVMVRLKYEKLTKVQLDNWRNQGRHIVEPVVKQLHERGKLEQREPANGNRLARYSRTVTDLEIEAD
jgi:hypothetical protein